MGRLPQTITEEFLRRVATGDTRSTRPPDAMKNPLRCEVEECGKPADTLHWLHASRQWMAACPAHDPGGYWFPIGKLAQELGHWMAHLAETKRDGAQMLSRLGRRLGYSGGTYLDSLRKGKLIP